MIDFTKEIESLRVSSELTALKCTAESGYLGMCWKHEIMDLLDRKVTAGYGACAHRLLDGQIPALVYQRSKFRKGKRFAGHDPAFLCFKKDVQCDNLAKKSYEAIVP